ncbi:hypothetical protein [Pseudomonas brassicacearum]|uniref:hypothetical protein n=1 Tax=Pseudomonas brassicacearum TaxID=930166 RepID=UPI0016168722|nr:hypothetical protein [Pseudomonas brassicacearum]
MGELLDMILAWLNALNGYTPPRRKRVFSLGFVVFSLCMVILELVILNDWVSRR